MNIYGILTEFQLSVSIQHERKEYARRPGEFYSVPYLELTDTQAQPAVTARVELPRGADDPLVAGVVKALRQWPEHPALRRWYKSCGNELVALQENAVECFGEAFFSAVRKCCASPESSVLWNAQDRLHPDDWATLLQASRDALNKLAKDYAAAGKNPSRRMLGLALQKVWTEHVDSLLLRARGANARTYSDKAHRRSQEQLFTLLSVRTAAQSTPHDEVVFGWTAYLCKDIETNVEADTDGEGLMILSK